MPKAVLFDLDDTITDRRASLVEYANFFQADFHQDLVGSGWTDVHSVITEADGLGYAAREDVFRALQGQLAWRCVSCRAESGLAQRNSSVAD